MGDRPNEVLLYQIYENAKAIAAHRGYPHRKAVKVDTEAMVKAVGLRAWAISDA